MLTFNQQLNHSEGYTEIIAPTEKHNAHVDLGTSFIWPRDLAGFINIRTLVTSEQYQSNSWELAVRKAF